jgi:putative protease
MVENAETRPEDKGKIISSMYTGKGPVYSAGAGDTVEIPFDSRAPAGSTVYRTHDKKLMDSLKKESDSGSLRPKIPVFITATIASGRPVRLEVKDRDSNAVTIESGYLVEKAENQPTSKVQIEKQLSKLGNTLFEAAELHVTMEGDVFVPVGQLNELRTKAIEQLEYLRISRWKRKPLDTLQLFKSGEKAGPGAGGTVRETLPVRPLLSVSVYSLEGLDGALAGGADRIYFSEGLFRRPETAGQKEGSAQGFDTIFEKAVAEAQEAGKKIYFITPKIVKDSEMKLVEKTFSHVRKMGADGILVSNLGVLGLAKAEKIPFIVDSPLNVFNSSTFALLLQEGAQMAVISPELTLEELKIAASYGPAECIVYGRLELMESEHCLTGGLLGNDKGQCNAHAGQERLRW